MKKLLVLLFFLLSLPCFSQNKNYEYVILEDHVVVVRDVYYFTINHYWEDIMKHYNATEIHGEITEELEKILDKSYKYFYDKHQINSDSNLNCLYISVFKRNDYDIQIPETKKLYCIFFHTMNYGTDLYFSYFYSDEY